MDERSHDVRLEMGHEEAIERVTEALAAQGFGVLSRIDIDEKFRQKLGIDFRRYTILGACNPQLANLALTVAPEIGLLLPCNVTVEAAEDGFSLVRIIDALRMMETAGYGSDPRIIPVGREADERLRAVARALGG